MGQGGRLVSGPSVALDWIMLRKGTFGMDQLGHIF